MAVIALGAGAALVMQYPFHKGSELYKFEMSLFLAFESFGLYEYVEETALAKKADYELHDFHRLIERLEILGCVNFRSQPVREWKLNSLGVKRFDKAQAEAGSVYRDRVNILLGVFLGSLLTGLPRVASWAVVKIKKNESD